MAHVVDDLVNSEFGDAWAVEVADDWKAELAVPKMKLETPLDESLNVQVASEVVGGQVGLAVAVEISLQRDIVRGSEGSPEANQVGTSRCGGLDVPEARSAGIPAEQDRLRLGQHRRGRRGYVVVAVVVQQLPL